LALRNPINNKNIVIIKGDKGNTPVVMEKQVYDMKIVEHLITNRSYRKLDYDPSNKIVREVTK
jgi:hypothetical protein